MEHTGEGFDEGDDGEGEVGTGALDFLRTQPQFQQLRQVVQTNPQLLAPLLQQIGRTNPQLLQMINQHPEEFMALLSEGAPGAGGAAPGAGAGGQHPGYVQVTPEEKAAIERLEGLGFDRQKVIEAFFACDKNEALAANYLFDHANDED